MNKERIVNNLKILGINAKSQLEKNEIGFWWEKKYIEIQRSGKNNKVISELLIQLNEAKEYLDEIDEMTLKECLEDIPKNTNKPFGKQNKRIEKVSQKQKTSNFFDWDTKSIKEENFYKNSQNNISDIDIYHKFDRRFWFFIASLTSALIFVLFVTREHKPVNIGNSYNQEKKVGNYKNKTINYSNGDKYIGEIRNDKRHGRGTYTWANGSKFSGEFENDFRTYGTYTFVSGNVYKGEFLNEKKHGQGTFFWVNGNKYVGGFLNEKKHGQGTFFWVNGDKYVGQWRNDYLHGQGTYYYASGNKYVGEWEYDQKHGRGTFLWVDGDKYVGEWKNDNRHGRGTYTWANGNKHVGEWKNDKRYR